MHYELANEVDNHICVGSLQQVNAQLIDELMMFSQ